VLYHKRLESGGFERPAYDEKQNSFQMKWSELVMMIEGLSMRNIVQRKRFVSTLVRAKEEKRDARNSSLFNP